ncbi:MAG: OmpA family protein [Desulfomonile tiedjei]|nr:OmpA family protein [Desulfomonile tiedjei]
MGPFFRDRFHQTLMAFLTLILTITCTSSVNADDCRRVSNILVLFDASGYMREKGRYTFFLQQMGFFSQAMPLTADGFFNVGIRHYGLKVGMGCDNTESILAIRPWDPERFLNSFPKTISYGFSSLSAGLRAAAEEASAAQGKSIIVLIGGGIESCKADPVKTAEQIAVNNPELEIHTFQIGNDPEGRFYLSGIAQKGRGSFNQADSFQSAAPWYAWMKRNLVVPCAPTTPTPARPPTTQAIAPVTFDYKSFSVKSQDPQADAQNSASLGAVVRTLQQDPTLRVVLHGYSDGKGSPEYNLKLSQQRAEAVARYLMKTHKIPASRISVNAHGMSQLPGATMIDDRTARRVEFEFVR